MESIDADRPSDATASSARALVDTVSYGDLGPDGFSIHGDVWDWDDPEGADPLMGWYAQDITVQAQTYGRRISADDWAGHGNEVPAPILDGVGSLWIGAFEDEADNQCWAGGLGYGNRWCQRIVSPVQSVTSAQDVTLAFRYFNDSELGFDYTTVFLHRLPDGSEVPLHPADGFSGKIGLATDSPASPPVGESYEVQITPAMLGGSTQFQLVFQFRSDGGWSDEDGAYETDYGPCGFDDVALTGGTEASYDFDDGDQAWTFETCPIGAGSYFGLGNVADYDLVEICGCGLSGNLIEFHDDEQGHPLGQREEARSNPTDILDMGTRLSGFPGELEISAEWDQYTDLPRANGVFYRPGWDYYPWVCPVNGHVGWSGRVGQNTFFYEPGPACDTHRTVATDAGVPRDCERLRFVYELYASCDAFGIPQTDCTAGDSFSPLIDNVRVRGTKVPAAPVITFAPSATGTRFQDGFGQTNGVFSPDSWGNADVNTNVNMGNQPPFVLGDSLFVTGPVSTPGHEWETRLWFRIRREGPGNKLPRYLDWKTDVASVNGNPDPTAGFAFAWMDSFQTPTGFPSRNSFVSYCREDNWYPGEAGEYSDGNEIIRDQVLNAGTAIDYFVTASYVTTPSESFFLPDTTGGYFYEFEILPGWRVDQGTPRYPCLLYVDTNSGAQRTVESALDALGVAHDRYDYNDASSNWKAPLARGAFPSTNGVPLYQLLGYRGILVNTGDLQAPMWGEDFVLFNEWLNVLECDGSVQRQGLVLNGDDIGTAIAARAPFFLNNVAGAHVVAEDYHGPISGYDENYCVRLETPSGGGELYGTTNSHAPEGYQYDAWGNWCPQSFAFDVLAPTNGGVGNRAYVDVTGGEETAYNQIARQVGGAGNYRVVIDGVSWHHLSARDAVEECVADSAHIVTAASNELAAALEWIYGGAASIPGLCIAPICEGSSSADPPEISDARVTRLYQNAPNPFNPRTLVRFSLARAGRTALTIFDASGRRVRTLVDAPMEAGLHEVVWDGTDDAGHPVASGVFWSQLQTDGFSSNKKMIVLR
ncbi:MAG: FlgD immunoglobulin-like domain containing protein [Candidatus Eisenbacteria bacterium]